jgi:hypothetical protein
MRTAIIIGAVAGVLGLVGLFVSGSGQFFQAYLFAFMFWIGISLGSLAFLLLHILSGNRWGLAIRRVVEAGAANIWVMAILFVPLLFGLTTLFPWARPAEVAASTSMQAQTFYLNVPFFIIRAVIYFVVWFLLAFLANRVITRRSKLTPEGAARDSHQGLGGVGLIAYAFTMSFAAIDWLMSLQPFWSSSVFGLLVIFGQVLTTIAFAVLALNLIPGLSLGRSWTHATTPIPYRDLGAMMMTLVMGWAYLAYFQLLIIWAGNLPHEVSWYIARTQGGWSYVAIFVAVFQFVLPFLILISARVRHNMRILSWLSILLLVGYLVNLWWNVKPAFYPGFSISWLDFVLPVAIGGFWVAGFLYALKRRPLLTPAEEQILDPVAEQTAAQAHQAPGLKTK